MRRCHLPALRPTAAHNLAACVCVCVCVCGRAGPYLTVAPSKMEEGDGSGGEEDGANGGDLQAGLRGSDAMLLNDVDLLILQERQEAAEAIAQDAVMLQDVTQELATLVADQGEQLNTMEKNVDEAKANTQAGLEHLEVVGCRGAVRKYGAGDAADFRVCVCGCVCGE